MKKIKTFILTHKGLIAILVLAGFLRIWNFKELFYYSHDNDLSSFFVKDILVDGHFRLIGQETSTQGVFIGPLFYYLLIPFYILFKMDPIGGVFLSFFIGLFTVWSVYFVFTRIFSQKVGLIGSLIYALSFSIVLTDREVVPTTLAMPWTVWFLYSLFEIYKGSEKKGLFLTVFLIALVWHINLALIVVAPLIFLCLLFSEKTKRAEGKTFFISFLLLFFFNLPFLAFEVRHNFSQTKSIFESVTTDKAYTEGTAKGLDKFDRVMQLVFKNTTRLFVQENSLTPSYFFFLALVSSFLILFWKKLFDRRFLFILFLWQAGFILFFTLNPINISEYYINGMNIVWVAIASLVAAAYFEKKRRWILFLVIFAFAAINLYRFGTIPVDRSGYIQKKALIEFIKNDAQSRKYPCISISYITTPGRNLGYRYLFYIKDLHVNQPSSGSPVYTIVFPHSMVDRLDHTFGALGLVLPDYSRYNKHMVRESCSGENANLTDPIFGFTK